MIDFLVPQVFGLFWAERHPGEDAAAYVQDNWIVLCILGEYLEWLRQDHCVPRQLLREARKSACQVAGGAVVGQITGGECNSAQGSLITVLEFLMESPEWFSDCQIDLGDLNEPMLYIRHKAMKAFTSWAVEHRRVDAQRAADFIRWADQVVESL